VTGVPTAIECSEPVDNFSLVCCAPIAHQWAASGAASTSPMPETNTSRDFWIVRLVKPSIGRFDLCLNACRDLMAGRSHEPVRLPVQIFHVVVTVAF
jgi:hypothetical protein